MSTTSTESGTATTAKSTTAAKTATASATIDNSAFIATLQRAIDRLADWPGAAHNFVTVTNYTIDQSLDALDDQLDTLVSTATASSPAKWVSDLIGVLNLFVVSAIPDYSFSDTLNAWGDFLNRVVPPFTISSGADTFGVITPYKIMAAAVAGTATIFSDMLEGEYDPAQWAIDAIYVTTGATVTRSDLTNSTSLEAKIAASIILGGGVYSSPEEVWDITLPTWTAAQVNPFTIVTYVVLVALYKRFQEMAALQTFTTSTTYTYAYTIDLGSASTRSEYAAGTFTAVDSDGNEVSFSAADGNTYTSAWGALVTINTYEGGFTYTATLPGTAYYHAGAAGESDTVEIPVVTADGVTYTVTFDIKIISTTNSTPTATTTVGTADSTGVVRGTVNGSDSDGDTLTYSLVSSSVTGASNNSAYTTGGGIVTLDANTGAFTYVSSSTAGSTQSFQVQVDDGHGGTTITTVTVTNTATITASNTDTSTLNVVTGSIASSVDSGIFTSYTVTSGPSKGTLTYNSTTGTFTYTRDSSLGHSTTTDDTFTVLATDANGRSVSLVVKVSPTVADAAPVVVSSTTDVGNASSARWNLNTSTWTQTTTGTITATDSDGDTLTYSLVDPTTHAAVTTTTDGGTVTFNSDGTYTYTITKNKAYFHAAAKIGATAADTTDTFTVAVSDGMGGVTYTTVTMTTYAVNTAPTISAGSASCAAWVCSVSLITIDDADDDLDDDSSLATSNNGTGRAWYTITQGSLTVWGGAGVGTSSIAWTNSSTWGTSVTGTETLTVYDGYYTVTNGVVDTSSPAKAWVSYTSSGKTSGN